MKHKTNILIKFIKSFTILFYILVLLTFFSGRLFAEVDSIPHVLSLTFKGQNLLNIPIWYSIRSTVMRHIWMWAEFFSILLFMTFFVLVVRYIRNIKITMKGREFKIWLKYRNLFNNMPIPYLQCRVIDNNTFIDINILKVNKAFNELIMPEKEILNKNWKEIEKTPFRLQEKHMQIFRDVLTTKKTYTNEILIRDYFYHVIIMPSEESDMTDIFFIDITNYIKSQKSLEHINHKLSMAINAANMIYWHYDIRKDIFIIEKMVQEIDPDTGIAYKQLRTNILSTLEDELQVVNDDYRDSVRQLFLDMIDGKVNKGYIEYKLSNLRFHNNPDEAWEELYAETEHDKDNNETSLVGVFFNVTKRKQLEQKLRNARDKAEESNRLKSAFLANMSHEIRTPLNAIVGFSNLLPFAESEKERHEFIDIIESNNSLLLQLIDDILDLSKIDAGTLDFSTSEVSVDNIIEDLIQSTIVRNKNENVQILCGPNLPGCMILVSKNRLMQVLINLVNNSMKFTEKGSITIGYELLANEGMLKFFVRDTGIGIPKDKLKDIFNRFVQLDNFAQGSGLGLSICNMIIQKMGGNIWVESEFGEWTCFEFTIPYLPIAICK